MLVSVVKRSTVLWNSTLFLILSSLYIYILHGLGFGVSALDSNLWEYISSNPATYTLLLFSALSIFILSRGVLVLFSISCLIISGQGIGLFIETFDKTILFLDFVFLLFSFYFFLILKRELAEAFYVPCFRTNYIGDKSEFSFAGELSYQGQKISTSLTNWNRNGCFVYIDKKMRLKGTVGLVIHYEGQIFTSKAKVITSYGNGYGLKFLNEENNPLNWTSFYDIIEDRGLFPRVV